MGFIRVLFRNDNLEIGLSVLGVGYVMALFGKNAYFSNKWIQYTGKRNENNELVPVDTILKFRFESILNEFDFTEWNKKYISMYINKELDPNAIGSSNLKQGIKIGVPEYFQRLSDESIKKSVSIKNEVIDWDCPAGQQLLDSLKLGEYAQKFIIATNIGMVDSYYTLMDTVLPGFTLAGAYCIGSQIYDFFKLHRKPLVLNLIFYTFHIVAFSALYVFLNDALYTLYYSASEVRVTKFGTLYIQGGIEYYRMRIQRNKALRELLKDGHKYYTEDGNEQGIFRVKGMIDTFKLIGMKERLEDFVFIEEQKKLPQVNPNPHPIM